MRVLVACETSGRVRRAFDALGHDVWSCDLLPAVDRSNRHIVCDVRSILDDGWDLLAVMHPPCTRLCNSGVRWLSGPPTKLSTEHYTTDEIAAYAAMSVDERIAFMWQKLDEGAALFSDCWNAPIERVAVEDPVMHRHAKERIRGYQPPAQTVQPWWFGDPAFKATSFYLRGLPPLVATKRLVPPRAGTDEHKSWSKVHRASPGPDRWKIRSETFPGIAAAMAAQWGGYALEMAA
ncbi:hypothetical protein [Ferirhizobium litorale]|uniref:DNA cytosine methyltransferase n=1 Tax=Ferirhizobium litorale TaxID=2927786 RepID=A0AAE3QJN4_9HYPH|nr:hypothetical protein [Fererhizobium litorale]MDI7924576.1 hypothetical protein [Fererhizobium litorale]